MYQFIRNDKDGIIETSIEGVVSFEAFAAYATAFRQQVREARRRGTPLRVLIDVTDGEILPMEIADSMSELEHELLTSPFDRVAVVTPSALRALQARDISTTGHTQTFASLYAGRRWLNAPSEHALDRKAA